MSQIYIKSKNTWWTIQSIRWTNMYLGVFAKFIQHYEKALFTYTFS